jgi:hypothetical protein
MPYATRKMIRVSDRRCVDCGGSVTLFLVPDKVWDGLGFKPGDFGCIKCVARRLNPQRPPTNRNQLAKEILRQRRRFKLESHNTYEECIDHPLKSDWTCRYPWTGGLIIPPLGIEHGRLGLAKTVTSKQLGGRAAIARRKARDERAFQMKRKAA